MMIFEARDARRAPCTRKGETHVSEVKKAEGVEVKITRPRGGTKGRKGAAKTMTPHANPETWKDEANGQGKSLKRTSRQSGSQNDLLLFRGRKHKGEPERKDGASKTKD